MKVYLNVYDIMRLNKYIDCIGIGAYHTGIYNSFILLYYIIGIEVCGVEYAYGGNSLCDSTGIYEMIPKRHDVFVFKYSIVVGEIQNEKQVWEALRKLFKKYKANQYDMLKFNCNHFTHEFLTLLLGIGLPRHLNRIAYMGSYLHCIVPKKYLIVTPADSKNYDVVQQDNKESNCNVSSDSS